MDCRYIRDRAGSARGEGRVDAWRRRTERRKVAVAVVVHPYILRSITELRILEHPPYESRKLGYCQRAPFLGLLEHGYRAIPRVYEVK